MKYLPFAIMFLFSSMHFFQMRSIQSDGFDDGFDTADSFPMPADFGDIGPEDSSFNDKKSLPGNKLPQQNKKPTQSKAILSPLPKMQEKVGDANQPVQQEVVEEIKEETMQGEGILKLSEDQRNDLVPSGNPKVIYFFEQTKEIESSAQKITNLMALLIEQARNIFDQIEQDLDTFFQSSGVGVGRIETLLKPELFQQNNTINQVPVLQQQTLTPLQGINFK